MPECRNEVCDQICVKRFSETLVNVLIEPLIGADIPFSDDCSKITSSFNSQKVDILISIPTKEKNRDKEERLILIYKQNKTND